MGLRGVLGALSVACPKTMTSPIGLREGETADSPKVNSPNGLDEPLKVNSPIGLGDRESISMFVSIARAGRRGVMDRFDKSSAT